MRVTWTESVLIKDREHTFVCTPCGDKFVITCEQDRRVNIKTASCVNFALRGADVVRELFYAG